MFDVTALRPLNIFIAFIISTKKHKHLTSHLSTSNFAISTVFKISIQSVLRTQVNISYHKSSSNFPGKISSMYLQLHACNYKQIYPYEHKHKIVRHILETILVKVSHLLHDNAF